MKRGLLLSLLALAVFASAIALVYSRHRARVLFGRLQALEQERDRLEVEWGRLQLEESAWANQGRIERLAREKLGMRMPDPQSVVIVR